ncbi:MAG: hypothetical protein AB7U97_26605 [Pirellulales bacterium]
MSMIFFAGAATVFAASLNDQIYNSGHGMLVWAIIPPTIGALVGAGIGVLFRRVWLLATIGFILPFMVVCYAMWQLSNIDC